MQRYTLLIAFRPRQQSLGGVLRREGNWRCLVLSALLAGCLAAAAWCRLAQVQRVVINFSVDYGGVIYNVRYPIKRTRQMSPCDDGYIYIPVAFMGLLYLVYLVECYHCTARLQLAHRVDVSAVADRVRAMRMAKPKVWWKAVCYHYVRRKRQVTRYRNGDAYTTTQVYFERVNSHSASATFAHAYCGFKDVSRNLILDSRGPITKIRFSKGFAFSNIEAASEFEDQRSRFFAQHERYDMYMEMREGLDLVGVSSFKEYMVAYRDTDRMPWYSSQTLFWVLSCLLLSWPLRILIECNTAYVHYTVTKIFGVNYDIETTRRRDLETHTSQHTPPVTLPRPPPLTSILSSQSAILANNMELASSSTQHINILALARSRNGLEQTEAMSHTSTIDSLELFATIRENCVLVPSYSEALLLSSLNDSTGDIATIVKSTINNLGDEINLPQNNNSKTNCNSNLPDFHTVLSNNTETYANGGIEVDNVIHKCLKTLKSTQRQTLSQDSLPSTSAVDIASFQDTSGHSQSISTQTAVDLNNQVCGSSTDQCSNKSAIIDNITNTPKRTIRIMEEFNITDRASGAHVVDMDDSTEMVLRNASENGTNNKYSSFGMHTSQSNYSLRTNNNNSIFSRRENSHTVDKSKAQNRKSWSGFLSKPVPPFGHYNRIYGSARIRPVPLLGSRRNSLTDSLNKQSDEVLILNEAIEEQDFIENGAISNTNHVIVNSDETDIPIAQIESIDRNLGDQSNSETGNMNLYFASPLLEVCPTDPLGGRGQTTPTEDPPPYEIAINLPVIRRITRSITDRGELFGQSRAFINDTILNRRSCVDNIISGTDSVRLIQNTMTSRERGNSEMETNL